jgi:hypothetical protein
MPAAIAQKALLFLRRLEATNCLDFIDSGRY